MNTMLGTPNLFILGAAKSGTTSLYRILSRHPDIQVSAVKEPSYFCSYFQDVTNPIAYYSLFDDRFKWRVDASHVYLTNPESPQILSRLFPQARFILILRDPRKRAYSLYRHMRRDLHADGRPFEDLTDFTAALFAEDRRFHDDSFWRECRQYPWNFFYWRSSCFDEEIARYLALFPREQFLILSLAQLRSDPKATCRSIADFLDVDAKPMIRSGRWHFNADPEPDRPPVDALEFLESRLSQVQARVEALLGQRLDFSI